MKSKSIIKQIPDEKLVEIRKILLIQYKPFGDILLNTGYLPVLKRKFSDATIDFLIQRPYITLLKDNPFIDNLVIMEKKKGFQYYLERWRIMKEVRSRNYDLIIDQLRGTGSAQITLFSGAKFRLGWKLKRWNWVYNYKVARENIRYYALLKFDVLKPLGIKEDEVGLYYKIEEESLEYIDDWLKDNQIYNEKLVIVSPGTPVKRKQWSLDNFVMLCDLILKQTNFKLILLWGPGEQADVDYIAERMVGKAIIALPTTFNQAAALLTRAAMYIGNDGGINHLAVSTETPSIAIFGPTSNPKKWVAWHKPQHMYLRDWDFKDRTDSTFNISPEQVFEKFKEYFKL